MADGNKNSEIIKVIIVLVEHMMSMMSATGFDCPPEEYFERYIMSSHGFLLNARKLLP